MFVTIVTERRGRHQEFDKTTLTKWVADSRLNAPLGSLRWTLRGLALYPKTSKSNMHIL